MKDPNTPPDPLAPQDARDPEAVTSGAPTAAGADPVVDQAAEDAAASVAPTSNVATDSSVAAGAADAQTVMTLEGSLQPSETGFSETDAGNAAVETSDLAAEAESFAASGAASTPGVPVPIPPTLRAVNSATAIWRDWIAPLVIILALVLSFRSALADWNDVPTGSMLPTIIEGDRIYVNKLAYSLRFPLSTVHLVSWDGPERGDIIVFLSPEDRKRLVKRVVGVPGDVIELQDNRLILNGEPVTYDHLDETIYHTETVERLERLNVLLWQEDLGDRNHAVALQPFPRASVLSDTFGPVEVPENEYFVMGDNRDVSRDSRFFGTVDRSLILGEATAVMFSNPPADPFYSMRGDRWFVSLD
ncbi:MAG: signal peptidase I [Acidobacteriota bacterium]